MILRYWCAVLLVLCLSAAPAFARAAADGGSLFTIQLVSHGNTTRITLGLVRSLAFHAAIDANSGELAVDFDGLTANPGGSTGQGVGLVRSYYAAPGSGGVRLIFNLGSPAVITAVRALPPEPGLPARAVVELAAAPAAAMRQASGTVYSAGGAPVREAAVPIHEAAAIVPSRPAPVQPALSRTQEAARAQEADRISALIEKEPAVAPARPMPMPHAVEPAPAALAIPSAPELSPVALRKPVPAAPLAASPAAHGGKRTIVIDAGHGGIDPGAEAIAGYHEKEVTLATARVLRRVLEETGRYKVVLTRDSDTYLKLHERVALARAAHGDLFISLHADSAAGSGAERSTRGASIYTLSETASDVESERYAQRENRADAIGGVDLGDQSDDVAGILVDLTVRETVNDGNRLAGMLAGSLEGDGVALLPHAPHRAAGFAVLKSPDIPSVLIEMGYLSDIADARALADPRHQLQIARGVADGVDRYFSWRDSSRS